MSKYIALAIATFCVWAFFNHYGLGNYIMKSSKTISGINQQRSESYKETVDAVGNY